MNNNLFVKVLVMVILLVTLSGCIPGLEETVNAEPTETPITVKQPVEIKAGSEVGNESIDAAQAVSYQRNKDENQLQAVRKATVLISIVLIKSSETNRLVLDQADGIGSLISFPDGPILVTHNHWGAFLSDEAIVKFYDVDNEWLCAISGEAFKKLIVHTDPGKLVLRPPERLMKFVSPIPMSQAHPVAVGELVYVVYRQPLEQNVAAIQQGVIEQILDGEGCAVYKVRSMDNLSIQPGDSGGGVWHEGALVGVNWRTDVTEITVLATSTSAEQVYIVYKDTSKAAIFTDDDH